MGSQNPLGDTTALISALETAPGVIIPLIREVPPPIGSKNCFSRKAGIRQTPREGTTSPRDVTWSFYHRGLRVSTHQLKSPLRQSFHIFCATSRPRLHMQPFGCIMCFEVMKRDVFQAIADPTRRAIIALIAMQALTPKGLAEHFDTSRQAVSKHLRILAECELVTSEQRGREIYYSLEIDKMKEIDRWLERYRKIWETRYEQLDALLAKLKQQQKQERTK